MQTTKQHCVLSDADILRARQEKKGDRGEGVYKTHLNVTAGDVKDLSESFVRPNKRAVRLLELS